MSSRTPSAVALGNDLEQFTVFLTPLIERRSSSGTRRTASWSAPSSAKDGYRELVEDFLVKSLWERIRHGAVG